MSAPRAVSPLALVFSSSLLACSTQTPGPAPGPVPTRDGGAETETDSKTDSETAVLAPLQPIAPSGEHPFSVLDMLEVDRVSSPALSPDGRQVVYRLRETDMAANRGRSSLWLSSLDADAEPVRIDAHPEGAGAPIWDPSGAWIYFISSRSGSSQVWRLANPDVGPDVGPSEGAGPEQVTDLPVGIANLRIGPDGTRLVVTAELFPECADLACTAARLQAEADDPTTGVVYGRMFVRHWDTWKDHRRGTLLSLTLDPGARGSAASEPLQTATILSRALDADVPSKPFGGPEDITFTPDGNGVVFAARDAAGGPGEPWSTNFDLFYVALDGAQPPERLTENPAWDAQPQFSPDGSTLAWVAMARPGYEADRFRLVVQDWSGDGLVGEPRVVTDESWDRSISSFLFSPDGSEVLATAQHLGHKPLFVVDLETGDARLRLPEGTVSSVLTHADTLVWIRHDLTHPAELFTGPRVSTPDGDRQLTHHNDALMARAKVGEAEQFSFVGAGGDTVYGWVVKPVDFDPEQRYPIAFLIHGGPQGSFGNKFHHRWNPQAYAGAGYASIMIDFHGSTGYGQAFTDAINRDWGGKPLEDLQKGLAHATRTYPWLDADRACALGASYGGYMINWIAGNWPERFRCLVNHDGIFDQRMMYYATEELWFPEWEHGGPEFEVPQAYARFNPADHVSNWHTPMLVIHGSLDYRVPLEQGLATFTALQRRGVESQLLHFPDENHWVLSPANSKQWHDRVIGWLDAKLARP